MRSTVSVIFVFVALLFLAPLVYPGFAQAMATFNRDLTRGLSGDSDVVSLQQFLSGHGYYSGPISGNFGSLTEDAVRKFQQANNLSVSGIFDGASRGRANDISANPDQPLAPPPNNNPAPESAVPSPATNQQPTPSPSGATQGDPGKAPGSVNSTKNYVYTPSPTEDQGFFGIAQPPIFCTCSGNFLIKVEGQYGGIFIAKKLTKIPVGLAIGTARGVPEKCKMFAGFGCITLGRGKVIKEIFGGI